MSDSQRIAQSVVEIVLSAGDLIRESVVKPKQINHKGRNDLVTETDLAVELFLKDRLGPLIPGSSFLAEETATHGELLENTWIIDPIDGTTNFAHGLPMVATSVALYKHGQVAVGVINLPLLNEVFVAVRGGGATMNGEPISVSEATTLEHSLLATGFPYAVEEHLETVLTHLRALLPMTQGLRRPGAAALDLAYVACGRYDGFYESALNPWDTAAGLLLVEEAGGRVSEYAGGEYQLYSKSIVATNGFIHDGLCAVLGR